MASSDAMSQTSSSSLSVKASAFSIASLMADSCHNSRHRCRRHHNDVIYDVTSTSVTSALCPGMVDDKPEEERMESTLAISPSDDLISDDVTGDGGSRAGGEKTTADGITCHLEPRDLWDKFHALGTEMIITKSGRRMFPTLRVSFSGCKLSARHRYDVYLDIQPVDGKRYRYAYHRSSWIVAGRADPAPNTRLYRHPDSPFTGDQLARHTVVSFEKLKLTNNSVDKNAHIVLNSMHKYQPRIQLVRLKKQPRHESKEEHRNELESRLSEQSPSIETFHDLQMTSDSVTTFVFKETMFTAVTAYQNQLITQLKIDSNPFAKGFRDVPRFGDFERDIKPPKDYLSSYAYCSLSAAPPFNSLIVDTDLSTTSATSATIHEMNVDERALSEILADQGKPDTEFAEDTCVSLTSSSLGSLQALQATRMAAAVAAVSQDTAFYNRLLSMCSRSSDVCPRMQADARSPSSPILNGALRPVTSIGRTRFHPYEYCRI